MTHASPPTHLHKLLDQFALQTVGTSGGVVGYRQVRPAGVTRTLVLLHGIGSASASWVQQLQAAEADGQCRVLAWDAPGYGASAPVAAEQPLATDYAERVWQWLDAMDVQTPITLVGHSLGAIMAARAVGLAPQRVERLVLLSPARGYGNAPAAEREQKLRDRLENLRTLGPKGMAEKRGAAMLSAQASAAQVEYIQSVMAQIDPAGYAQAAQLLSGADLVSDVAALALGKAIPMAVASGNADTITPPSACQSVAAAAHVDWQDLGPAGHACALEAAAAVNALLGLPNVQEVTA